VENYLLQGKDGQLGITGEGSLLENAKGKIKIIRKKDGSIFKQKLQTLTCRHKHTSCKTSRQFK
jgi:hypothetical protein